MISRGRFRGELLRYSDGVGGCIWIPLDPEHEDAGLAMDFDAADLDDMIALLTALKTVEPAMYVPPEDSEQLADFDVPGARNP